MRQNVENGVKINKMRQCPFLGKRKALSDHNYYVHPKYLHECVHCGRTFKTKLKCRKHEERLNCTLQNHKLKETKFHILLTCVPERSHHSQTKEDVDSETPGHLSVCQLLPFLVFRGG